MRAQAFPPYSFRDEFGSRFAGTRVLVTGASGFVGTHLVQALREVGARVTGVGLPDLTSSAANPDGFLATDLTEAGAAAAAVESVNPELVFHLAGLVDTRQVPEAVIPTLKHNLLAAVHLMDSLVGIGCQRVVIVTSSESPPADQVPNSPYAASKLAVASYAGMYSTLFGLPVVIARPHMVFGPNQSPEKVIPYLIHCGLENKPPRLASGKRLCDPVYVMDLVRALLLLALADGASGRTVDIGAGMALSIAEIARRVLSLMGASSAPAFGALPDRTGEVPQVADLTSLRDVVAWEPLWSFDRAIRETIDWYAQRRGPAPADHSPASHEGMG